MKENRMRDYETMVVLHPELSEVQAREALQRARGLIEGMAGRVLEVNEWGTRELAYPIRKVRRGFYAVLEYQAEPAVVTELERTFKISDEVLRYVTVTGDSAHPVRPAKSEAVADPAIDTDSVVSETEEPLLS
jgi:small subunit ribosomal protein S6